MPSTSNPRKPRVVALGYPKYAGEEYIEEFKTEFDFEVLEAKNRIETQERLPQMVAGQPIDAFIIRMGTPPYEPFDEALLKALLPGCKIIASASAGFVSCFHSALAHRFDILPYWPQRYGMMNDLFQARLIKSLANLCHTIMTSLQFLGRDDTDFLLLTNRMNLTLTGCPRTVFGFATPLMLWRKPLPTWRCF